jgi:hypothetical protein
MNPLESELIHPETPQAKFDLTATLRSLSTILTDTELGAVSPLVASEKRAPEGLFRHNGSLFVRYFTSQWYIRDGVLERFSGMPPFMGIEKLEIPKA